MIPDNHTSPNNPPDDGAGHVYFPEIMTESELIRFLRIPEVSKSKDHHNVIENLKRMHDLPCIHISQKPLYPLNAVRKWVDDKVSKERKR